MQPDNGLHFYILIVKLLPGVGHILYLCVRKAKGFSCAKKAILCHKSYGTNSAGHRNNLQGFFDYNYHPKMILYF
tara:strand:+ start:198 stop:422 length:225 start_codon:yes stop_codon:yes gene_type:complete